MTPSFTYHQPTEIRFGPGRVREVGEAASRLGRRCLLVTAKAWPGMAPVYEQVRKR